MVSVLLTYEYLVSCDRNSIIGRQQQQQQQQLHKNDQHIQSAQQPSNGSSYGQYQQQQRFKHIPFKFNLLSILDKSQLALIKFRTLYQWFNISSNDDDGGDDVVD